MKRYNRDKRSTQKMNTRKTYTHMKRENCDAIDKRARIRIHVKYDGYNKIEYVKVIHGKTRNNKAQTYINMTNAMNEIFPEINAPHTARIYRATATYHKYIPQATTYTRPEPEPDTINKDTRTVKCIIMNDNEDIIYIGKMRRTRTINYTKGTIDIMLHRNKRTMQAYERAINPDKIIHSITVREIKAHDVEIYYI